jgi:hypothetical protein
MVSDTKSMTSASGGIIDAYGMSSTPAGDAQGPAPKKSLRMVAFASVKFE